MAMQGDVFQSESTTEEQVANPKAWMCRPCELYWDEGRECRRIRARIHQYFIFGETLDCSQWTQDYKSCMAFRRTRDQDQLNSVIKSEERRFRQRMHAAAQNNVWKYRSSPPDDWAAPLPDYLEQRTRGSLFEFYSKHKEPSERSADRKQTTP